MHVFFVAEVLGLNVTSQCQKSKEFFESMATSAPAGSNNPNANERSKTISNTFAHERQDMKI
jgi:hypothetical protein